MTNLESIPKPADADRLIHDWRESPNGQGHYRMYRSADTACAQFACLDGQVYAVDLLPYFTRDETLSELIDDLITERAAL